MSGWYLRRSSLERRGQRTIRPATLLCLIALCGAALGSCARDNGGLNDLRAPQPGDSTVAAETDGPARLTARPASTARGETHPGQRRFRLDPSRESYLFVPPGYSARRPAPFIMMLHGAGGNSLRAIQLFEEPARSVGAVLFAPQAEGRTWDVIGGDYGPDVAFIDRALRLIFENHAIDPSRVAVGGFSDGASYALSLGISNGDLFRKIIALSPGFAAPGAPHGRPRIFIAHGKQDGVLPFESTSKKLVSALEDAGYDVTLRLHPGGHGPYPRLEAAWDWFVGR